MKKILKLALKLLVKGEPHNILLIFKGYSGSNAYALYKFKQPKSIKIILFHEKTRRSLREKIHFYKLLYSSKLVISTHGTMDKNFNSYYLELWHGLPLKNIGILTKSISFRQKLNYLKRFRNIDYIISTSEFYSSILRYCFSIENDKFIITGLPRNDFLFKSKGESLLKKMFNFKSSSKIIFYLPTFRPYNMHYNIYDYFTSEYFLDFLDINNFTLFLKIHPNEENQVKLSKPSNNRIILIRSEDLESNKIDLYELLNAADLLITDYSSVFFDFLLLNKPILFFAKDISYYKKYWGFLLEPYEFWTPGPKVYDFPDLKTEILKLLNNDEYYLDERIRMKNLVHYYQDGNSSARVWEFIMSILKS